MIRLGWLKASLDKVSAVGFLSSDGEGLEQ